MYVYYSFSLYNTNSTSYNISTYESPGHRRCRAIIPSSSSDLSHVALWIAATGSTRTRRSGVLGLTNDDDDDIRSPESFVCDHGNIHGIVCVCICGIAGSSDPNS